MDDMLVKSLAQLITYLVEMLNVLYTYSMKLNPNKCTFRVSLGTFLGVMINQRGIETNLDKIKTVLEMEAP